MPEPQSFKFHNSLLLVYQLYVEHFFLLLQWEFQARAQMPKYVLSTSSIDDFVRPFLVIFRSLVDVSAAAKAVDYLDLCSLLRPFSTSTAATSLWSSENGSSTSSRNCSAGS